MRSLGLIIAAAASAAIARLPCTAKNLGGGQDDGPNILATFKRCAKNGMSLTRYCAQRTWTTSKSSSAEPVSSLQNFCFAIPLDAMYSSIYAWYRQMIPVEPVPNLPKRVSIFDVTLLNLSPFVLCRTTFWSLSWTNNYRWERSSLVGYFQSNRYKRSGEVFKYIPFLISHIQNAGTAGGSSTTFARLISLTVGNASDVVVEDITQIGSPF